MSHSTPTLSPPGTPLLQRSIGELVAETPGLSRIFQRHSIDFCCQGGRTLAEACAIKNLDPERIVAELEAALAGPVEEVENPAELPLSELADYIVARHHKYLRDELPRLHAMSTRVAHVHGGHTPTLVEVHEVFTGLLEELSDHMEKEERVLFPEIHRMARGERAAMPLDGPIHCMVHEHESAGQALERLRELTNDHTPPPEACNTYRALFSGLRDLEEDLHRHIHLENHVLFPAASRLALGA